MPIYSYKCRECGDVADIFLHRVDGKANCPGCGSQNLERLVSTSYMLKANSPSHGSTCCGRTERCDKPPCSSDDGCRRDKRHG
jgi:putative FmdB family regulatory protein